MGKVDSAEERARRLVEKEDERIYMRRGETNTYGSQDRTKTLVLLAT